MTNALAFFGAFNPPTMAHLNLARYAMEETGREQVVFVPSKAVYIREEQGKDFAYSDTQRLQMLRAAAGSRPWMAVTDWEMRQEKQPRTYDTLRHLRERGIQAALLIGSDKLKELEHAWRHVEEIAEEFGFVCLGRSGDDCGQIIRDSAFLSRLSADIRVLETPADTQDISSTKVRQLVLAGRGNRETLSGLVPEEIIGSLTGIYHEK